MVEEQTFFPKKVDTVFFVKNISVNKKTVRAFGYPVLWNTERDLLGIPYVSEAAIRHELLKGHLRLKLDNQELIVTRSNIDLLQFDPEQKSRLQSFGITYGIEIDNTIAVGNNYARIRNLLDLVDGSGGGPLESYSGAYREILPNGALFPTQIVWWTSSAKIGKIFEKILVRDPATQNPLTITWNIYNDDGVSLVGIVNDIITYNGAFESTRTRTITEI